MSPRGDTRHHEGRAREGAPLRIWFYRRPFGMPQGIIRPTKIDQAWVAADPVAALLGYGSTILAVFGVFDAIGLDADQVAILGGAVLGVMGSVRTIRERRLRNEKLELHHEHAALEAENAELKKKTGSLTDGEVPVLSAGGSEKPQEEPEEPEPPSAA